MALALVDHSGHRQNQVKTARFSRFDSENELVDATETIFKNKIRSGHNQWTAFREFDCGNGIADLVFVILRKDWQKFARLGKVQSSWTNVFQSLPYKRRFRIEDFLKLSGVSEASARKFLNHLVTLSLCEKVDADSWRKISQPRPLANKIVNVECKLKDWRRALQQAIRYYDYSNESWVVLDEKYARPAAANVDRFKIFNVGLASISKLNQITILHTPTSVFAKHETSFWQANSALAKRMESLHVFK